MKNIINAQSRKPIRSRKFYFVVYPGFELLDLTGPMSVLSAANDLAQEELYVIKTLSAESGLVKSGAGLAVESQKLEDHPVDSNTSLFVVGANMKPLVNAASNSRLIHWIKENAQTAERFGSICSGTFILQSAGVLSDKVVTTHWAGCEMLKQMSPQLTVLEDSLYHIDGKCWTSAGVTTGIDMALEMLKHDHGNELMQTVAKYLVIYSQRPGKQSQFAQIQDMRPNEEESFAKLINWLKLEINRPIKIGEMADFMCMSERSFQRKFTSVFSCSPARFFERMRMEHARDFLLPKQSVEQASQTLGYRSIAAFRTAFEKQFGITPSMSKKVS